MSSGDEVSVWGAAFDPESTEQDSCKGAHTGSLQRPGISQDLEASCSGEGEGQGQGQGQDQGEDKDEGWLRLPLGVEAQREVMGAPGTVRWDREARPGLPTVKEEDALAYKSHVEKAEDIADIAQQTTCDTLGVCRNPSPESCTVQPSDEGPFELSSDSESSADYGEIQLMTVSLYLKTLGQTESSSSEDPGDTPRHFIPHGRETRFPSARGRRPEASSVKKMQGVGLGKRGGGRPSYPGAAAAAAPRRQLAQGNKSLHDVSKVFLETKPPALPAWGQRACRGPLEPATLPPICGIPLLQGSNTSSSVPLEPKHPKNTGAVKKPGVRRTRELDRMVEGDDPNRDPVPKGQLPTSRPGPSCLSLCYQNESSGEPSTRAPQVPAVSRLMLMSQRAVRPREPAPSGDQGPPANFLRQERWRHQQQWRHSQQQWQQWQQWQQSQQQWQQLQQPEQQQPEQQPPEQQQLPPPPGEQGCARCVVLQREIDELKDKVVALQSLIDSFQIL